MVTGKDEDLQLGEVVSTVEMAEALRASGAVDDLLAQIDSGEVALTGEGGLLPGLIKLALERGLAAELTDHLGYEKGDPAGRALPNARNGTTPKTVQTEAGPVPLDVPRDRDGSFTPRLVQIATSHPVLLKEIVQALVDVDNHLDAWQVCEQSNVEDVVALGVALERVKEQAAARRELCMTLHRPPPEIWTLVSVLEAASNMVTWWPFWPAAMAAKKPLAPPPMTATQDVVVARALVA